MYLRKRLVGSGESVECFVEQTLRLVLVAPGVSAEAESAEREPCAANVAGPTELLECLWPSRSAESRSPCQYASRAAARSAGARTDSGRLGCLGERHGEPRSALVKIAPPNPRQKQLGC